MLWRQWRLCIGWLKRWRHWEFWPPWLFYLPLLPSLFLLMVRYRSALVVTAVNPGITRHGRFIVNRKSKKLAALPARAVPRFVLLRAAAGLAARLAQARAFAAAQGLPLVLKPDLGGRGSGVWIVRSLAGLERDVALVDYDVLLQAFAPGEEYGVFWVRAPGRERGRIVSITRKALPSVVGDGVRTVAQLVLAHPRAVCFAPLLLHNLGRRAREIPAAGEHVQVGELGTHSRGALFRDARDCRTAALERAIAELAAAQEGFHFGRFDIRVASEAALRQGEGLQVLELNALGAEMTHIWDPRLGLRNGWRTLRWQWQLAFHFGHRNRRAGASSASIDEAVRELAELWALHQRHEAASDRRSLQAVSR